MTAAGLDGLKPSELKGILRSRGIPYEGVLERQELVDLVLASGGEPAGAGSGHTSSSGGSHASASRERPPSSRPQRPRNNTPGSQQPSGSERARKDQQGEAFFLRLAAAAEALGVSVDSSDDAVRAAQKKLMREWHPDKHPDNIDEATRRFTEVQASHDLLVSVAHKTRSHALRTAKRKVARTAQRSARREAAREQQAADERAAAEREAEADAERSAASAERAAAAAAAAAAAEGDRQRAVANAATAAAAPQHARHSGGARSSSGVRETQFQDILAAAARERESTRRGERAAAKGDAKGDAKRAQAGPTPMAMEHEGGLDDGFDGGAPKHEGVVGACVDCFTCCAEVYILCQSGCVRCQRFVCECGGLLRMSQHELDSWGYREGEQPARCRSVGPPPGAHRRAVLARRANAERRAAREAAKGAVSSPDKPRVVAV